MPSSSKKRILPFVLTTLRLLLGPIALVCAFAGVSRYVFLPILILGTVSDILDGVLARRFGVSSPSLRRCDSGTDVIYYLFILATLWVLRSDVIIQNWPAVGILFASEAATVAVSLTRFGKYPATHSWLAKFYGLCLPATLIGLLAFAASSWVITSLVVVSVLTNCEIIVIHFMASSPPVDVPSIFVLLKSQNSKRNATRDASLPMID